MDNVTARINQVGFLLPNPALMSSPDAVISRVMAILRPVIMDERVVQFINSIRQQDMRTELLKTFWKCKDSEPPIPIVEDHVITNRTYLTSISFLLASPGIPHSDMMKMFDEVDRVFNTAQEEHIRAEAADIMHRFYPERGEKMLNALDVYRFLNIETVRRYQDNEEVFRMIRHQSTLTQKQTQVNEQLQILREFADGSRKVIFNDSENVHNTTINESVIATARALIEETVATVTFDGCYKFDVFRDDTIKSITSRLADVLKRSPEDVTIMGDNDKQVLQPRMTYRLSKDAKSTKEVSRFKSEELGPLHECNRGRGLHLPKERGEGW